MVLERRGSSLSPGRVDVWIWLLIYGGMVLFGLGLAVRQSDETFGWSIAVVGIVLFAVGAVLIWIRSRMKEKTTQGTP